jgi:hypothetical protein
LKGCHVCELLHDYYQRNVCEIVAWLSLEAV